MNESEPGSTREESGPREFRTASVIGGRALFIAYAVTGWIPVICVREVLTTEQPIDEIIQLLSVSAMSGFVLGWLTWSWLEYRHFGQSICRVAALPAAGARWFEAEVECNLPLDSAQPIVVRLKSQAPLEKNPKAHWQIEQEIDPAHINRLDGRRVVVPVRMSIPAGGGGPPARRAGRRLSPVWSLEVSRKSRGMNFHAQFLMPVAEPPDERTRDAPR